jgi:CRISPR-associated protein Cmr3
MVEHCFLRPLDVLYLRGNRLFGGPGDHGEALMPPWPSMAAGALRSRMLVDGGGTDLAAFAGGAAPAGRLGSVLGTPVAPGTFRVADFTLGRTGKGSTVEPLRPLPADLVALPDGSQGVAALCYLAPVETGQLPAGIATSYPLDRLPLLRIAAHKKPVAGCWLTGEGWGRYLAGEPLEPRHVCRATDLWETDPRLGIALDAAARTAAEGQIYTTDAVALRDGVGFVVAVAGAEGCLPADGLVRLGGDGRGAGVAPCTVDQLDPPERIEAEGRCRIGLTTPGLFPHGWRLPGMQEDWTWRGPEGVTARVVAAAVGRHEVVSGWDLATNRPKAAQRIVPVGAVYWLDELAGDIAGLRRLLVEGLWPLIDGPDPQRRAEGFNNVWLGAWGREPQE